MSELEQSPSQLNATNNNINNNIGRDSWKTQRDMSDTDRDALVRICIDGVIMLCGKCLIWIIFDILVFVCCFIGYVWSE